MFTSHEQSTKEHVCTRFAIQLEEIIRFLIIILKKCFYPIKFIKVPADGINVIGFKDE